MTYEVLAVMNWHISDDESAGVCCFFLITWQLAVTWPIRRQGTITWHILTSFFTFQALIFLF